jgi:hypothetical protein
MSGAVVVTRGDREISLRFDTFPTRVHGKLEARIREFTDDLEARIRAVTPRKTGLLQSEITEKIYASDTADRVAGYVSVFAGDRQKEYAKAATLEYGSNKPRQLADRGSRIFAMFSRKKRFERRLSKTPHIEAFRYLRDPFDEMKPEIQAGLEEAVAEAAAEDEGAAS